MVGVASNNLCSAGPTISKPCKVLLTRACPVHTFFSGAKSTTHSVTIHNVHKSLPRGIPAEYFGGCLDCLLFLLPHLLPCTAHGAVVRGSGKWPCGGSFCYSCRQTSRFVSRCLTSRASFCVALLWSRCVFGECLVRLPL